MSEPEKKEEPTKEQEKQEESKEAKDDEKADDDKNSKSAERPDSGGRKSLDGLSPSQDAKVGTLKQMFQDYDDEVLCSVLFEQCNGDLDKSIETILKMQKVGAAAESEGKETPQASSLADTDDPSNNAKASNVDKETQELIDEMIAEEEQARLEAEQEAEEELARQQQELRQMEQRLLEEDLKANRLQSSETKDGKQTSEGQDLLNKFQNKFKQSMQEFKEKFGHEPSKDLKGSQRQANGRQQQTRVNQTKTMKDMVMDDTGVVEIYDFQMPQYSNGDWTLFSPRFQTGQEPNASQPVGAFNLPVDNDEAIDLERPDGTSASTGSGLTIKRNIQVHSAKRINRGLTDGLVSPLEYDDLDVEDEEIPNIKRALSDKMNDLKRSFTNNEGETVGQRMKDSKDKAVQKAKESKQAAAEKMKAMGEKFKSMF